MSTDPSATTDQIAHTLAYNNLIHVFSNRDPVSRMSKIKATYHPDVQFFEPTEILVGHDAINTRVQSLLDERPGWDFVPMGKVMRNHDTLYLAWGFGPRNPEPDNGVHVQVKGADVIFAENGLIKKFWVLMEGISDVKV
jgi:hypothetical protein